MSVNTGCFIAVPLGKHAIFRSIWQNHARKFIFFAVLSHGKCTFPTPFLPVYVWNPTPLRRILHPILHPKMPINTGCLRCGCRKCRIFFKNFFWGIPKLLPDKMIWGFENIGLLWGKHPYFRCKTSVLLPKEVRCFWFPETWFCRLFPANESYRLKQRNQQKHSYETVFEHYVDPQNEKFDKCRCKYRRNH